MALRSLISPLLALGRPTQIPRFIVAVVVSAVYAVLRRGLWPQLLDFRFVFFKGLEPKFDAYRSVIFPVVIVGIIAAGLCTDVSLVQYTILSSPRRPRTVKSYQ